MKKISFVAALMAIFIAVTISAVAQTFTFLDAGTFAARSSTPLWVVTVNDRPPLPVSMSYDGVNAVTGIALFGSQNTPFALTVMQDPFGTMSSSINFTNSSGIFMTRTSPLSLTSIPSGAFLVRVSSIIDAPLEISGISINGGPGFGDITVRNSESYFEVSPGTDTAPIRSLEFLAGFRQDGSAQQQFSDLQIQIIGVQQVPEPSAVIIFSCALVILFIFKVKHKNHHALHD